MKPLLIIAAIALTGISGLACVDSTNLPEFSGNDSVLSAPCNWAGNHNAIEWLQPPTVSQGIITFWGSVEEPTSGTGQWGYAPPGVSYHSPFHIYGDCLSSPIVTILPPLPGTRFWNTDENDTVAEVWETTANSFRVTAQVPAHIAEYGKLELHVGDVNGDRPCQYNNCSLGIKRISFE